MLFFYDLIIVTNQLFSQEPTDAERGSYFCVGLCNQTIYMESLYQVLGSFTILVWHHNVPWHPLEAFYIVMIHHLFRDKLSLMPSPMQTVGVVQSRIRPVPSVCM